MKILPSSHAFIISPRNHLLALLLAVSCLPAQLAAQTVTGRVVAGTNPVAGVQFVFDSPQLTEYEFATSDAQGNFSLPLPPGTYETLTLSYDSFAPGHAVENRTGIVVSGNTNIGNLRAVPIPHLVSGTVGHPEGPLESALVWTATFGGIPYKVSTSTDFFSGTGSFSLFLGPGAWQVTAAAYYEEQFIGPQTVVVGSSNLDNVHIFPPSPFRDWAASYGLAGPQAWLFIDHDGDGYDNGAEFAFGTHPQTANGALMQTTRVGSDLRMSWLERTDGSMAYSLRGSTNPIIWSHTNSPVQTLPGAPAGYALRQVTAPAQGRGFFRILAAAEPATIPVESFSITVAGAPVTVERWGRGPKAVVFFGYIPFTIQQDLKKDYATQFSELLGEEYSMFLWSYPDSVAPFSQADGLLQLFFDDANAALAAKLDFTGHTASVVNQIRAITGLTQVCVVGNSFGAGVALADWTALSSDPNVRFVLISPTEVFMPALANLPSPQPLPRTVLVADAVRDPFFETASFRNYITARTNAPPPDSYVPNFNDPHFIIGQTYTTLSYVFGLVDRVYQQP